MGRDQDHVRRSPAGAVAHLPREVKPALAAEVDVDQRNVWSERSDLAYGLSPGRRRSDHLDALFLEQTTHLGAKACVVVHDQAPQSQTRISIA